MRSTTRLVAAAFLGALLACALNSAADFITLPKVWSFGERLDSADLNNEFSSITAQVNGNLRDVNLASDAGIVGSKLADSPSGITTGKINDEQITRAKILPGATWATSAGLPHPAVTVNNGDPETPLASQAITTRGGPVLIFVYPEWTCAMVAGSPGCDLMIKLYRDGTLIAQYPRSYVIVTSGNAVDVAVPGFTEADVTAPPGAHSYEVRATLVGSVFTSFMQGTRGHFFVVEFS